jgi:L-ribulose-5-phosphate 4-epimerase
VGSAIADQDDAIRRQLVDGCRILAAEDMSDYIWGHVSVRASREGTFWLKGAQMGLEEVTIDDLILVDFDGNVLEGSRDRHIEWPIHAEVYRVRPDVTSVVHSHAFASVAFGATGLPLANVGHEAARWIPPDIPRFTETSDLIDSPELGRSMAAVIGSEGGALLRHHGMVVVGRDVPSACIQAIFLEQACRLQLTLLSLGVPYEEATPGDELVRKDKLARPNMYPKLWDYLRRRLERHGDESVPRGQRGPLALRR